MILEALRGLMAELSQSDVGQVATSIIDNHEAQSAEFARHRAAVRMQQSVRPQGGRREGLATAIPEQMAKDFVSIPKRAFGAVQQYEDTGEYNPAPIMEAATALMGGGVPAAERASAGIFGGRLAKTADQAVLAKAEDLAAKGATREQIWNETGWFQGKDGKWRFEIDDSRAGVFGMDPERAAASTETAGDFSMRITGRENRGLRYDDIVQHPDLYAAYPISDKMASVFPMPSGQRGQLDKTFGILSVDSRLDPWDARSTGLHELQHAVQRQERFAQGGSPAMFKDEYDLLSQQVDEINKLMVEASRAKDMQKYYRLMDKRSAIVPRIQELQGKYGLVGEEQYRRLAGEVEARNVQARKDMTAAERRASPPWTTEDVPFDEQSVLGR